MGCKDWME